MQGVSVPCGSCRASIRFGRSSCPQCGAPVSTELADALEARLEATSNEFHTMRNRIIEARILLVVLGVLQIALTLFLYLAVPDHTLDDSVNAPTDLVTLASCVIGIGMILAAGRARRRPVDTFLIVIGCWVALQTIGFIANPLSLVQGLLAKIVFMIILGRGLYAAQQAEKMRRELAEQAARFDY